MNIKKKVFIVYFYVVVKYLLIYSNIIFSSEQNYIKKTKNEIIQNIREYYKPWDIDMIMFSKSMTNLTLPIISHKNKNMNKQSIYIKIFYQTSKYWHDCDQCSMNEYVKHLKHISVDNPDLKAISKQKNIFNIVQCPDDMSNENLASNIAFWMPWVKLLFFIQNPIIRLNTHVLDIIKNNQEKDIFQYIYPMSMKNDIYYRVWYERYFKRFYNFFPDKNILIINTENILQGFNTIQKFIGLKKQISYRNKELQNFITFPKFIINEMENFFAPYNTKLCSLLKHNNCPQWTQYDLDTTIQKTIYKAKELINNKPIVKCMSKNDIYPKYKQCNSKYKFSSFVSEFVHYQYFKHQCSGIFQNIAGDSIRFDISGWTHSKNLTIPFVDYLHTNSLPSFNRVYAVISVKNGIEKISIFSKNGYWFVDQILDYSIFINPCRFNKKRRWMFWLSTQKEKAIVHFVGSVWRGNKKNFDIFAQGCNKENIKIIRHGINHLPKDLKANIEDDHRDISEEEALQLHKKSLFITAIQGSNHINKDPKKWSYIPERALNAAALGIPFVSNNPNIKMFFYPNTELITYEPSVGKMCYNAMLKKISMRQRNKMIQAQLNTNTYINRFEQILDYF